ncbi:MAG: VWA domain-containing protein [Bacteroidia bacterium]|nr:VWA domain-containing protein [Bacteroidia bacterium]
MKTRLLPFAILGLLVSGILLPSCHHRKGQIDFLGRGRQETGLKYNEDEGFQVKCFRGINLDEDEGFSEKEMERLTREGNFDTEDYAPLIENEFLDPTQAPLSTFSIDVDAASYSNCRRYLMQQGELPPKGAVRIEEFINYFDYNYPQPSGEAPVALFSEYADCPWNKDNKLVMMGLQAKKIPLENLPPSNLVFLLDVSGSMDFPNKLPLLKQSFRLLVKELRPVDRVAVVVYAGAAGLILPSTPGDQKDKILDSMEKLEAGGSTAGGEGILLAYKIAKENFLPDGNNRIIMATDGDFNVGASSEASLVSMVEEKRKEGVFLTVLGFGMGNYKDSKMESLADKGNGNYAYIDNLLEAQKVLVNEFGGTLFTVAKDVKFQVEFNPTRVKGYRLIGYENRLLAAQDFNDDEKDAGEMGSGHTVTALYEIIPAGGSTEMVGQTDPLKYQSTQTTSAANSQELLTLKFRYKLPADSVSRLVTQALPDRARPLEKSSENFRFAAAVAEFAHILRQSKYIHDGTYSQALELAHNAKGEDVHGYRAEFIRLVETAQLLSEAQAKE